MYPIEYLHEFFLEKLKRAELHGSPRELYDPVRYILDLGGKRLRPIMVLMSANLYSENIEQASDAALAIEVFHNFTLMHDDIMDKAPLRRGKQTVHTKYNDSTALLAGDVMLVRAYEYLNKISSAYLSKVLALFNRTAIEVCEGQQMDMDYESQNNVNMNDYLRMIELKTSVALAASLKVGGLLGGGGERNQNLLYEFGKKLGIAFQVQDDYLDAFGEKNKTGKQVGGDILANKKTFLLIHAMESASHKKELEQLIRTNPTDKVEKVVAVYKDCKADEWARQLKNKYFDEALNHLEDIAVLSKRKEPLRELALFLVQRDF